MNSSDEEFEKEIDRVQQEKEDVDNLDESEFQKFEAGELDLPEYEDDEDMSSEGDVQDLNAEADDSELDDYYRELGIDPEEMIDEKKQTRMHKKEEKLQAKYEKRQKIKSQREDAAREREEVLNAMMNKAREQPNFKTLNRIIAVVR